METCKECLHRIVCAVYGPNFDDVLEKGKSCSEFTNTDVKAEAIKEFAERLKGKGTEVFGHTIVVSESDIDNLVKEMLGKEDE